MEFLIDENVFYYAEIYKNRLKEKIFGWKEVFFIVCSIFGGGDFQKSKDSVDA